MLGVAYVDIPAVEGLNGFSKFAKSLPGVGERFSAVAADNKEEPPVGDETTDQQPQGGTTPPASTDSTGGATSPEDSPPPTGQSQPPADPDAGNVQVTSQHATGTTTHTFTIAGVATTDFAAVQAHITELENFEKETLAAARDSYVAKLADDQKIFSSQTASLQKLVRNMTEEQFGDFKESYNNSPKLPTLATHAVTPQAGGTPEGQGGHEDPEVEQARRVYNRHLQMGLPKDQLENTDSYKLLKDKGIV